MDADSFLEMLQDDEVKRLLRAYEPGTITMDIHCHAEGGWTFDHLNKNAAMKSMKVTVSTIPSRGSQLMIGVYEDLNLGIYFGT